MNILIGFNNNLIQEHYSTVFCNVITGHRSFQEVLNNFNLSYNTRGFLVAYINVGGLCSILHLNKFTIEILNYTISDYWYRTPHYITIKTKFYTCNIVFSMFVRLVSGMYKRQGNCIIWNDMFHAENLATNKSSCRPSKQNKKRLLDYCY